MSLSAAPTPLQSPSPRTPRYRARFSPSPSNSHPHSRSHSPLPAPTQTPPTLTSRSLGANKTLATTTTTTTSTPRGTSPAGDAPTGERTKTNFMSFDLSVKRLRAVVLDWDGMVVVAEEVGFDGREGGRDVGNGSNGVRVGNGVAWEDELAVYGTRGGTRVTNDGHTSPTEMYVKAVDILLEKISYVHGFDFGTVGCISGAAQQHASVFWSHVAPQHLSSLDPSRRLSSQLTSQNGTWSLPDPPNCLDTSTTEQARCLERCLAGRWRERVAGARGGDGYGEGEEGLTDDEAGAKEMAWRTGSRCHNRFTGPQIMKIRQTRPGVLEQTGRVSLSSSFLASLFIGSIAPIDEADACGMNLYNIVTRTWDDDILSAVAGCGPNPNSGDVHPESERKTGYEGGLTGERLRDMLGEVERDGGKIIGKVAGWFVQRFGFDPECLVCSFTGDNLATFLSYPVGPRDAMIGLGIGDADTVMVPSPVYIPDPARHVYCHPAEMGGEEGGEEKGEGRKFVAMLSYKDAGLARSFVRDVYCNASWLVFNQLVGMIPPGGTIGLDNKLFSFFYPHGEMGVWQGVSRMELGRRVTEYTDLRANPRAILESQFMSMRIRLSRIYASIMSKSNQSPFKSLSHKLRTDPYDHLGFDPYSHRVLPSKVVVAGGATGNGTLLEILGMVLGANVFKRRAVWSGGIAADSTNGKDDGGVTDGSGERITSSSVGAALKAMWCWARHQRSGEDGSDQGIDTFERFSKAVSERTRMRTVEKGRRENGGGGNVPTIFTSLADHEVRDLDENGNCTGIANDGLKMDLHSRSTTNDTTGSGGTFTSSATSASSYVSPTSGLPSEQGKLGRGMGETMRLEVDDQDILEEVAECDEDQFRFYGGMVEEFLRLESLVARGLL